MLEIWHVALLNVSSPSLFIWRSKDLKWTCPTVSCVCSMEIHRKIFTNLLQNSLAWILELWCETLPGEPAPSLFKRRPRIAKQHCGLESSLKKGYIKFFLSPTARFIWLQFGMKHYPRMFKYWSWGSEWLLRRGLDLNHTNTQENIKISFWSESLGSDA